MVFALKNSTTLLLPQWYNTLTAHKLSHRMMPRDVSTRWNSTFDMLDFALEYRLVIDTMTATRDFDLRKYELVSAEWDIAGELRDVLQVFYTFSLSLSLATYRLIDFQRRHPLFLLRNPEPSYSDSGNGPYRQGPCHFIRQPTAVLPCHPRCSRYWQEGYEPILQQD
jgi:hypothetical protein